MWAARNLSAQQRLGLLSAGLAGASLLLLMRLRDVPAPAHALPVSAAAIAVLFVAAEMGRLHIEVRRSAITVTLSDVAAIVALFSLPPVGVVLLRQISCVPVLLWLYRRSPARVMFNAALMLFESTVCAVLLIQLSRAGPAEPEAWFAALAAVQLAGMLAGLSVTAAIGLNGDDQTMAEVIEGLALGAAVSAVTGVLGVIAITVLAGTPQGRWLLLAALALGLLAYWGYARLLERKAALESVHAFTRRLDAGHDRQTLLRVVLSQVPQLVGAARAELVMLDDDDAGTVTRASLQGEQLHLREAGELEWQVRQVLDTGRPLALGRHTRRRAVREVLRDRATPELMVAPVPAEAGIAGALVAIDRLGQVRGFRPADLMLFETLTTHAGVALAKTRYLDQLRHDVGYDRLTGLLNRRGFADALDASDGTRAVITLRLTSLDEVNDAFGHAAGDSLLQAAADRITRILPPRGAAGRVATDVFGVLMPDSQIEHARAVAAELLAALDVPVEVSGVPVALNPLSGVAGSDDRGDLLRFAEIALRKATAQDRVEVHEAGMAPSSGRRLGMAAQLRQVLNDPELAQQLVPFYQPKCDLRTGRISGVEALVRWQRPRHRLALPAEFIPVVESTDLVRPLTLHMLDRALADAIRWRRAGFPLNVAVNLSARNLHDPHLLDDVAALLSRHAIVPQWLTLEITESAMMEDPRHAQNLLEGLAALGLSLSVDDFGTGYSSLAYLARLPVHEVKIDRTFISHMTTDRRYASIVRSIVDLSHSLGLLVVGEGVEDQGCWDALADTGVDMAQGYLLSRPLPATQLDAWLSRRQPPPIPRQRATGPSTRPEQPQQADSPAPPPAQDGRRSPIQRQ